MRQRQQAQTGQRGCVQVTHTHHQASSLAALVQPRGFARTVSLYKVIAYPAALNRLLDPNSISPSCDLYQKTGETPISLTILDTPPNVAMTKYLETEGSKQRGRPKHRLRPHYDETSRVTTTITGQLDYIQLQTLTTFAT
ncbi:hypothetical protein ElyMa_006737300 [Elysia marginata]|uniref:Uncharacterized protein n=1 Tax=Elysia marginata TaxID=1093978 RepID=A0AAV4IVX1_9GAST|nr:hypothetical protein ElyMa_006737300 [Elysia marginata]